ncbi:2-amino-4-hydroxy-6-hydroxymethyldihyropteridine pyrophosphokinase [Crenothrix polyspora]|uniref:2-amino-4-hydroxy-6-hydroxymethyldihydropteridine pyrophosphokinase n=1 Tax=Crenothrix polyspora TaxID=360316 RepID=A0A1R4H2I9_9GAMM|nr:2-amino-4-hydroxy-6-hydroxymethyldihyropteridine pyrophosphokinase [Crenothrix polyspora]
MTVQNNDIVAPSPTADTIIAYIGMGSNLANPVDQLTRAYQTIATINGVQIQALSAFYHSPPMGPQDQPDYVNAVLAITTQLLPLDLLHSLQTIENQQGRARAERWGARTLDLDILLYGDQYIVLPELIIPHIGLTQRAFVLYPLYDIAPQLHIPGKGDLKDLRSRCPLDGLKRLDL